VKEYEHTQIGYLLIAALGAAVLMTGYLIVVTDLNAGAILLLAFMILCLALFGTLTVKVNAWAITIQFGIGVIRKQFALQDIQTYRTVRNPWYYGWGIHLIPGGWIYNVSGWEAVELQMKNGRKYRIGTDDTQGLMDAVSGNSRNQST
jgi:hypothetical protein